MEAQVDCEPDNDTPSTDRSTALRRLLLQQFLNASGNMVSDDEDNDDDDDDDDDDDIDVSFLA